MKAKATVWYHYFDMATMLPVSTSNKIDINVKFSERLNKELMKVAITDSTNYESFFKENAFAKERNWLTKEASDVIESIVEVLGKNVRNDACKIGVEFEGIDGCCFMIRDFFGSSGHKFVDSKELEYCISEKERDVK